MSKYMYAVPGTWPHGPHTLDELRTLMEEGKLTDETLVCQEHTDRWVKIGVLLGTLTIKPMRMPSVPQTILAEYYTGGRLSGFLLSIGQLAAILTCLAILIGMFQQLTSLTKAEQLINQSQRFEDQRGQQAVDAIQSSRGIVWVVGSLSVCLSVGLFIVFKRAKSASLIAASQDTENQRLWRAIDEMRNSSQASGNQE